ncbi:protein of unknown function [Hyphomicrobium sp. MC1]|nr:protein of unknown function [Hyphomicrobium sp. MC1]
MLLQIEHVGYGQIFLRRSGSQNWYYKYDVPKIERRRLSLKSRILLENYYLPGDLERAIAGFVDHYNHAATTKAWTTSPRPTSTSDEEPYPQTT